MVGPAQNYTSAQTQAIRGGGGTLARSIHCGSPPPTPLLLSPPLADVAALHHVGCRAVALSWGGGQHAQRAPCCGRQYGDAVDGATRSQRRVCWCRHESTATTPLPLKAPWAPILHLPRRCGLRPSASDASAPRLMTSFQKSGLATERVAGRTTAAARHGNGGFWWASAPSGLRATVGCEDDNGGGEDYSSCSCDGGTVIAVLTHQSAADPSTQLRAQLAAHRLSAAVRVDICKQKRRQAREQAGEEHHFEG